MSRFSNELEEIWMLCENSVTGDRGRIDFVLASVECDGRLHDHGTHSERSRFPGGGSFVNPNSYYEVFISPTEDTRPFVGGYRNDKFLILTRPNDVQAYLKRLEGMIGKRISATMKQWRPQNEDELIELKSDVRLAKEPAPVKNQSSTKQPQDDSAEFGELPGFSWNDADSSGTDRIDADVAGLNPDGTRIRRRRT